MGKIPYAAPFPACEAFRLTPWQLADAPAAMVAASDLAIQTFTSMPGAKEACALDWIRCQSRQRQEGAAVHFALRDDADRVLGNVGLVGFDWTHGRAEVGYWVLPQFRRHGIASRALKLLSQWTFASLPVDRIDLFVDLTNEISKRTAERGGFEYEGRLRSFRVYRGERCDLDLYSLLPPPPPIP